MNRWIAVLVAALMGAWAAWAWAQGSGKRPEKSFAETTTVVAVEVPVQVLVDGKPVRGLKAEDFEIYEGRKRHDLIGFEVIDLSLVGPGTEGPRVAELPVSARRHFLLLFDLSFSEPSAVVRARKAATELVLQGLHPADLVAVGTYSESRGAKLVLGFTSDRRQVEVALDTLGVVDPIERVSDPLGIVIAELEQAGLQQDGGSTGGLAATSNVDDALLEQLRDTSSLSGRAARDYQQKQVFALTQSLGALAKLMASVQGRKHVVLLSEGFDSSLLLGTAEVERTQELAQASEFGEYWRIDSDERFGSTTTQSVLHQMVEEFRRADCTIQAVDIGGLRAGADVRPKASGQDGLFIMANETGGELYRNFNNLTAAMSSVLERTSVTYVLAFQPRDLKLDGSFHRIRVRLKNGPRGARVLHRPGYYAPLPYPEQDPTERRLQTAAMVLGGDAGGLMATSVLAAPFRAPGERAYVPVLVEIDGPSLLQLAGADVVPVEIFAYAFDAEGNLGDFFAQALGLNINKVGAALQQSGFKFWGDLDLAPGEYLLRVLVRDGASGASSLRVLSLTVPDFEQAEPALLPPFFPEPPGKWLLGRADQAERPDLPFPFMLRDQPFIPAAKPVIRAMGETSIALAGYHLGDGSLTLEGQLLGRDGRPVEGMEMVLGGRMKGEVPGLHRLVATLRLGRVTAGEYTLVVTVKDLASGRSASSSIPILVEG